MECYQNVFLIFYNFSEKKKGGKMKVDLLSVMAVIMSFSSVVIFVQSA